MDLTTHTQERETVHRDRDRANARLIGAAGDGGRHDLQLEAFILAR
jgi:hypothetical protein